MPLIVSLGMGLGIKDTSYLISSSLIISGVATLIQINRIGPIGSGLLSIQGTSFTFIGPLIYSYIILKDGYSPQEALGIIMGCCAACAFCMIVLGQFVHKLQHAITTNVSGATVILIGVSLVWTTFINLQRDYNQISESGENAWWVFVLAALVLGITFLLSRSKQPLLRISSVTIGLIIGFILAWVLGLVNFTPLQNLEFFFLPHPGYFPFGFDIKIFFILLPIFIISATEAVGDLSATAKLSGLPLGNRAYWERIRGGVSGDALNSFIAAVFSTFPNTSFSQNNGVIRLTGVCSRYVGIYTACMLIVLGVFPIVGGIFIIMPGSVLYGATALMFFLVFLSGLNIVESGAVEVKSWPLVGVAVVVGIAASFITPHLEFLPKWLATLLQFPISTGAIVAMLMEVFRPKKILGSRQPA